MVVPREKITSLIKSHGCAVIGVMGGERSPPFAYTIGLYATFGYELAIIGLREDVATYFFNEITKTLKREGKELALNVPDDRWSNLPCVFRRATPDKAAEYAIQAHEYWGCVVPVVQMVMPDREGRQPEHPEFDHQLMDPIQDLMYQIPS